MECNMQKYAIAPPTAAIDFGRINNKLCVFKKSLMYRKCVKYMIIRMILYQLN